MDRESFYFEIGYEELYSAELIKSIGAFSGHWQILVHST